MSIAPRSAMFLVKFICSFIRSAMLSGIFQKACIINDTTTKNTANIHSPGIKSIPVNIENPPTSSITPLKITPNSGIGTPFDFA